MPLEIKEIYKIILYLKKLDNILSSFFLSKKDDNDIILLKPIWGLTKINKNVLQKKDH